MESATTKRKSEGAKEGHLSSYTDLVALTLYRDKACLLNSLTIIELL